MKDSWLYLIHLVTTENPVNSYFTYTVDKTDRGAIIAPCSIYLLFIYLYFI